LCWSEVPSVRILSIKNRPAPCPTPPPATHCRLKAPRSPAVRRHPMSSPEVLTFTASSSPDRQVKAHRIQLSLAVLVRPLFRESAGSGACPANAQQ
jgi:hypothetical protein